MKPATPTNAAADSTPSAAPADSQTAEVTPGADSAENVTSADVAAALGLKAAGQETDGADEGAEGAQDEAADDAGDDAGETEAEAKGDDNAGEGAETDESDDAAAESEAAADAGESDTTEESGDEAAADDAAAEKPGKKHEIFQQRINELTARNKSAEEENAALREKVGHYESRDSGALDGHEVLAADTPEELGKLRTRYVALHKWALANPDGGNMPDGKGGQAEFTREQVAQINAKTFQLLSTDVPTRDSFIAARREHDAAALASYPWLADKAKGDGAMVQRALEHIPAFRTVPNARVIAANAFVGEKLRRAGIVVDDTLIQRLVKEKAAKARPGNGSAPGAASAPPRRAPAAPARTGTIPPRRTPAVAQARAAQKKLSSSSGSVGDLAASIAANM